MGKELKKAHPEAEVYLERTWQSDQERLKPDITFLHNGEAKFIDMTIPYERNKDLLLLRKSSKEEKYTILTPDNVPELQAKRIVSSTPIGIAIGSAGTMLTPTRRKIQNLGLGRHIQSLHIMALSGSASIWHLHAA